jgi:hypothetical protein
LVISRIQSYFNPVYDTSTLQSLGRYSFPSRVIHAEFLAGGTLMVLTGDQTVYQINAGAPRKNY